MAETSGIKGDVNCTGADTSVHNWTLSYAGDTLETTDFDDSSGGRSYIAGITNWSGSYDCYYDTGNTKVPGDTGTIILRTTTGDSALFTGSIIITGMDVGTPVDGIATQNYTFRGTGALGTTI